MNYDKLREALDQPVDVDEGRGLATVDADALWLIYEAAQNVLSRLDIVDAQSIADRLGVKRETVWMWRSRQLLPAPDWQLACGPIWMWETIREWAEETGRL